MYFWRPHLKRRKPHRYHPTPTPLQTPSHLHRLLSLNIVFLIIACCDKYWKTPVVTSLPKVKCWDVKFFFIDNYFFFGYQLVEDERSRWPGIIITSLLKLKGRDYQTFFTSILKLQGRDDQAGVFVARLMKLRDQDH